MIFTAPARDVKFAAKQSSCLNRFDAGTDFRKPPNIPHIASLQNDRLLLLLSTAQSIEISHLFCEAGVDRGCSLATIFDV
jgi:hypothetical protein